MNEGEERKLLENLLLEKYEPIAVVGVGLRFPGENDTPEGFAEFLRAGRSGTGPVPEDRWDAAEFADDGEGQVAAGRIRTAGGGFLRDFDRFDPRFFSISPKEAQYIDPQQRLALETCWEALEHAGIDPTGLRGGDGAVYFGSSGVDFNLEVVQLPYEDMDAYTGTGAANSAVSGRVSYVLGWRGPSLTVDTACSSSLVTLHLAVEALRRGECSIALAGGVNVIHHPRNHVVFSQAGMLAPDGECKTFDERADGYSRSEGCGAVVLKRLSRAKADGDTVLALVRGTAVRQDGESGGLTVPNGSAQEAVMRAALDAALLEPADVSYVEAHGTGTSLGDPIELGAVDATFPEGVTVGSLKTNVGHMEAAAGVGGLIKAVLQLQAGEIFPHLHWETPSPHIPWDRYRVTVPTKAVAWSAPTRRALVNSFGFAGTIASAVLEEAPPTTARDPEPGGAGVFALSAKTPESLRELAARHRRHLEDHPDLGLDEVCRTSTLGRAHFGHRIAGVVGDRDELLALLDQEPTAEPERKVALLFTGQGAQYTGMGAPLYARHPVFREHLDACDRLFAAHLGRSVKALMFGEEGEPGDLDQTRFTQPALFSLEYALAKLWLSWGIRPDVLVGHSVGEVAAAAVAGLFSLEDAVRLVAARGALMQSVRAPGSMVAVAAPAEEVAELVAPYADLSFGALNTPQDCVVSGGRASLDEVVAQLTARGVRVKELPVSHAFHSPLMAEITERFRASLDGIAFHEPELTLVSNVTGEVADLETVSTVDYWVRHVAEPVRFQAGMRAVEARGDHLFLEVGPADTLTAMGRRCVAEPKDHLWLASLAPQDEAGRTVLTSLVRAYRAGLAVDWRGFHHGRGTARAVLPSYAFDRRRYWLPSRGHRRTADPLALHPLLGRRTGPGEFTARLEPEHPRWLRDHVVMGQVLFPAAGYVELMLALQDAEYGETSRPLTDLRILEPLLVPAEVRTRVMADGEVEVVSLADGLERRHLTARFGEAAEPVRLTAADPATVFPADELYAEYADHGLTYGPEFKRITHLARDVEGAAVTRLANPSAGAVELLPPGLLDGVIQSLAALVEGDETYLPVGFGGVLLHKKPRGGALRSVARLTGDGTTADAVLYEDGRPVCSLRDIAFKKVVNSGRTVSRYHRPRWVKRSLIRTDGERRPVLVAHRDPAELADPGPDVTAFSGAPEEGSDVAWFWRRLPGPLTDERLRAECEENYTDLLALLPRLQGFGGRLWLVTEGAQDPADEDGLPAASLWGFGQTLWSEYPGFRATLLDLPAGDTTALADEWRNAEATEFQIAHREGHRHVRRIVPVADETGDVALEIEEYGDFSGVRAVPAARPAPPRGDEVEVRIEAAGLNFKDVLNTLGMLREHGELPLGFEGAGTVVAAGPDAEFAPGTPVLVSLLGALRSRVTVPSAMVARRPDGITAEQGAAVPTAFVTAWYALHHLAHLKRGDTVLVHAAAGGVGQAAVQLARLAGAEVYATASPRKWPLLREQGVAHVMNSRTTDFADEVLRLTGGRGVDVVLNSLNKEYVDAGFRVLAEGGRFVELGKLGIRTPEEARAQRPDAEYHNFDLSEFAPSEIARITRDILRPVADLISTGELRPPPVTAYDLDEVTEAFGVLSRGANTGKLVVRFGGRPTPVAEEIDPGGTYLITGGLGALGLLTAEKLVALGARRIALMSRGEAPAGLAQRFGDGVTVTFCRGDVADPADVARVVAELQPLAGVVHAAGVLADKPLSAMTWQDVEHVFRPKVYGARLLEQAAPGLKLFVGYSSVSAVLGPAGQANYAAANSFLDALMERRSERGLPGLSLDWGPWAEVGMAAKLGGQHMRAIEGQGMRFLQPGEGTRALSRTLAGGLPQVMVGEFDWDRFVSRQPAANALYSLVADGEGVSGGAVAPFDLAGLAAVDRAERAARVNERIRTRVAEVLQFHGAEEIAGDAPFRDLGLDSLSAVQLKNVLESDFRTPLTSSIAFDFPTVRALTEHVLVQLAAETAPAAEERDVAGLSDEQADAELAALLEGEG
ncbi:type I polyketide synthase [Streptomyces sp. NRRL F-5635]|uniref:type I polyketide synthase n=1 Tax=Streptomyces sp. NRRL F-5635 TaxID=1463865 RepID=UPI00099C06C8|nr:type I polyketide synthase [Streptomyces sp. NRRL F-5635]